MSHLLSVPGSPIEASEGHQEPGAIAPDLTAQLVQTEKIPVTAEEDRHYKHTEVLRPEVGRKTFPSGTEKPNGLAFHNENTDHSLWIVVEAYSVESHDP